MSDNNKASSDTNPIIVGIGASAGGVQALQTLFDAPPEPGCYTQVTDAIASGHLRCASALFTPGVPSTSTLNASL